MPFWGDASKEENYKAKLEHKMCIAKETPEAVFDLADCNLSEVPSGVFSMCRVFLKESLLLQDNNLSNLNGSLKDLSQLQVLNLKNNRLRSLPEDICYLINLQDLNLENNQLKKLPKSFEKLAKLCHLNLKGNKFQNFPTPVCSLHNIRSLNLCNNPKIKTLPKELGNLAFLRCLIIDVDCFTYPSHDICVAGTESIMKFLCAEMGREYNPMEEQDLKYETVDTSYSDADKFSGSSGDLAASYLQYQRKKEQRAQKLIEMEDALKENYMLQCSSAADANIRRKKLLDDIAQDQANMEAGILLLQSKKDKEKQNLLAVLSNVEAHSAKLIKQLMSLSDQTRNTERMLAVLERDRIENEEIFTLKQEELEQHRKREILEAMTEMLHCEEKQRKYEEEKNDVNVKLQNNENENNLKLLNIFRERESDQQILINKLLEEEQYQKEAFEVLQLQKDVQHQEIAHQIHLIEKELANLTTAEIRKKDLKINSEINVLAEHRTALASLLTELLLAKEQRVKELKKRLEEMELKHAHEVENYWLLQFQKLLERKPKGIIDAELGIDGPVKHILIDAGAVNFLPLFAAKQITLALLLSFTVKDLKKVGVLDDNLCEKILNKAREYFKNTEGKDSFGAVAPYYEQTEPSAPEMEEEPISSPEMEEPSAPPLSPNEDIKLWCQTECVICLDLESTAVFLPCGHVCCCQNCSCSVEICPMCRTVIASKFVLTIS